MTAADFVLLGWVALLALQGFFRGFAAQAISLAGIAVGGVGGAWLAPRIVGHESPWVALVSLGGAFVGALVLGLSAGRFGERARRRLSTRTPLRLADGVGGVAGGAALGLAFAWLAAVLLLYQPSLGLRGAVQDSRILPALLRTVPPQSVLRALDRFDPLPLLPQLADDDLPPPDAGVLARATTEAASRSVVKVEGVSCGLGVQGSGWLVRPGLVATNAHVVAGQTSTRVVAPDGGSAGGSVVYVDRANDVALIRVDDLGVAPLAVDARQRFPVRGVILGYPRDGALTAAAATAGQPRSVLAPDAYGGRVRPRTVIPLRGRVEHGESGGPVLDRDGEVFAMVFGGQRGGRGGYAVPVEFVTRALTDAGRRVETGPCVG
jgi:S1-C subfamily serine protease